MRIRHIKIKKNQFNEEYLFIFLMCLRHGNRGGRMKRSLLIFVLAIIIISLSACGEKEQQKQTDILLMHGWDGVGEDHIAMRNIYKEFEKQNPDIKLTTNSCPYSEVIVEKANNMLAVDKMPDIVSTNGISSFLNYTIKKGKALNLLPYLMEDDQFRNNIHPQILNMWAKNGEIYTIPDVLEVIGYWYNEDIFRKAKITEDGTTTGKVVVPKTWKEFWQACDKINQYNEENNANIKVLELNDYFIIGTFIGARVAGYNLEGTEFMNKVHPNDFDVEAFKNSIIDIKKVKNYNASILTGKINDVRYNFEQGHSAIYINGVWDSIQFEKCDIKDDINYATFPGYDGNTISFISASSGYVVSNDQNEEKINASIRFIKYMMSEEVQNRIALETKQAPQNPNLNTTLLENKIPLLGKALQVSQSAKIQIPSIETLWNVKVLNYISENFADVINDKKSVDDLVDEINKILN